MWVYYLKNEAYNAGDDYNHNTLNVKTIGKEHDFESCNKALDSRLC